MTSEEIKKITPYQDINNILVEYVNSAKNILGGNLVGIYLSGSLAYGDFVPARSDIDLQAVIKEPLTKEELGLIERLHKSLIKSSPLWASRIECSYVPMEIIKEVLPPKTPRPWRGFDVLYPAAQAGNEWIINHYFLCKYGIALEGPDFKELIPPVDMAEVKKASARDLFKEWKLKVNDQEWLGNGHYQSYLVLNLCRILSTVVGDKPGSKKVAAEWTKRKYPQWKDLIEKAEKWEYGEEFYQADETIEFINFAVQKVDETGILREEPDNGMTEGSHNKC